MVGYADYYKKKIILKLDYKPINTNYNLYKFDQSEHVIS